MDPIKAKTAEAVALVNGQDPMRGIMMLREILEEDPDNVEAHWHLGLFSVQSGQYDKALERFKKVIELDPKNFPDAWFYLGRTYATLDSNDQAIASLKKYKTLTRIRPSSMGWTGSCWSWRTLNNRSNMPCGKKRKRHKMSTHKRKKRLRKNRHKKKAR